MAGHGGGAWKVAYADFITAMMAFFMVMWITCAKRRIKEAVAQHFSHPLGNYDEGGSLRPKRRDFGFVDTNPKAHGDAAGDNDPNIRKPFRLRGNFGERTGIGTIILFPDNSTELRRAGEGRVAAVCTARRRRSAQDRGPRPRRAATPSLVLPPEDPWQLSYTRCLRTMDFLVQQGIPPERIRLAQAGLHEPQQRETQLARRSVPARRNDAGSKRRWRDAIRCGLKSEVQNPKSKVYKSKIQLQLPASFCYTQSGCCYHESRETPMRAGKLLICCALPLLSRVPVDAEDRHAARR